MASALGANAGHAVKPARGQLEMYAGPLRMRNWNFTQEGCSAGREFTACG